MAEERDLELLDDYLTHRMSDPDRRAFEQKLQSDPDLQQEYALQQRLISGIKDARVAELKSMLNQVPVPSSGPGNALATKIILGTFVTLIIAAASYWYISRDDVKMADAPAPAEQPAKEELTPAEPEGETEQEALPEESRVEQDKNQTSAGTEHSKPSLAKRPDPLQAPGEKNREEQTPGNAALQVETDRNNAQYRFHYQFRDEKVLLYGPFEANSYEIVEVPTNNTRTKFLLYKEEYYRLDQTDDRIQPLKAVTDPALLKTLKESRSAGK